MNKVDVETKRICLFAGYNANKKIAPYVVDYLKELSRYADVYYLADGLLEEGEFEKISAFCINYYVTQHGKYDFGSYSELAKNYVGWDVIDKYDELILANDSCFCVQGFGSVFVKMETENCDAWGLIATDENNHDYLYSLDEYVGIPSRKVPLFCIGSYFLVFRRPVFADLDFRSFLNNVEKETSREVVCQKYEMGLTAFLIKKDYKLSAFIKVIYRNVTIYDQQALRLLKKKFPLLKIRIFKDNPLSIKNLSSWPELIEKFTGNKLIHEYLKCIGFDGEQYVSTECLTMWGRIKSDWVPLLFKGGRLNQRNIKRIAKLIVPPRIIRSFIYTFDLLLRHELSSMLYKSVRSNLGRDDVSNRHEMLLGLQHETHFIIHFNVARNVIGGGMLSINRFVEKSVQLSQVDKYKILVSGLPLENKEVDYSMFEAASPMIHFSEIVTTLKPEKLILHIPEYYTADFIKSLEPSQRAWLGKIPYLQINIMNQNHVLFPDRYYIECCRELTDDVTITAAHTRYATQELADSYQCPVFLLTPFLPEFYRSSFESKENIILVSPDDEMGGSSLSKEMVIERLEKEMSDYEILIIENLTIDEYKRAIANARFTITFGEGFDGYYLEPFLSQSVAFAVYNKTFFPEEFVDASTVYADWNQLYNNIVSDIRKFESMPELYRSVQHETEKLIRMYVNDDISMRNLEDFYARKFTYLPTIFSDDSLLYAQSENLINEDEGFHVLKERVAQ